MHLARGAWFGADKTAHYYDSLHFVSQPLRLSSETLLGWALNLVTNLARNNTACTAMAVLHRLVYCLYPVAGGPRRNPR